MPGIVLDCGELAPCKTDGESDFMWSSVSMNDLSTYINKCNSEDRVRDLRRRLQANCSDKQFLFVFCFKT